MLLLARRLHISGIRTVIVSGGSALLSYKLLTAAWQRLYPEEKLNVYALSADENRRIYNKDVKHEWTYEESFDGKRDIIEKRTGYSLGELSKMKIAYIDDYKRTGVKEKLVRKTLRELGLKGYIGLVAELGVRGLATDISERVHSNPALMTTPVSMSNLGAFENALPDGVKQRLGRIVQRISNLDLSIINDDISPLPINAGGTFENEMVIEIPHPRLDDLLTKVGILVNIANENKVDIRMLEGVAYASAKVHERSLFMGLPATSYDNASKFIRQMRDIRPDLEIQMLNETSLSSKRRTDITYPEGWKSKILFDASHSVAYFRSGGLHYIIDPTAIDYSLYLVDVDERDREERPVAEVFVAPTFEEAEKMLCLSHGGAKWKIVTPSAEPAAGTQAPIPAAGVERKGAVTAWLKGLTPGMNENLRRYAVAPFLEEILYRGAAMLLITAASHLFGVTLSASIPLQIAFMVLQITAGGIFMWHHERDERFVVPFAVSLVNSGLLSFVFLRYFGGTPSIFLLMTFMITHSAINYFLKETTWEGNLKDPMENFRRASDYNADRGSWLEGFRLVAYHGTELGLVLFNLLTSGVLDSETAGAIFPDTTTTYRYQAKSEFIDRKRAQRIAVDKAAEMGSVILVPDGYEYMGAPEVLEFDLTEFAKDEDERSRVHFDEETGVDFLVRDVPTQLIHLTPEYKKELLIKIFEALKRKDRVLTPEEKQKISKNLGISVEDVLIVEYLVRQGNTQAEIGKVQTAIQNCNTHKVALEIGCGRADTAYELASANPGRFVIAADVYDPLIEDLPEYKRTAEMWEGGALPAQQEGLPNLSIVRARPYLLSLFPDNSLDVILLANPAQGTVEELFDEKTLLRKLKPTGKIVFKPLGDLRQADDFIPQGWEITPNPEGAYLWGINIPETTWFSVAGFGDVYVISPVSVPEEYVTGDEGGEKPAKPARGPSEAAKFSEGWTTVEVDEATAREYVPAEIMTLFDVADRLGLPIVLTGGTARDFAICSTHREKLGFPAVTDIDIAIPFAEGEAEKGYYNKADYKRFREGLPPQLRKRIDLRIDFLPGVLTGQTYVFENLLKSDTGNALTVSRLAVAKTDGGFVIFGEKQACEDLKNKILRILYEEKISLGAENAAKMLGKSMVYGKAGFMFEEKSAAKICEEIGDVLPEDALPYAQTDVITHDIADVRGAIKHISQSAGKKAEAIALYTAARRLITAILRLLRRGTPTYLYEPSLSAEDTSPVVSYLRRTEQRTNRNGHKLQLRQYEAGGDWIGELIGPEGKITKDINSFYNDTLENPATRLAVRLIGKDEAELSRNRAIIKKAIREMLVAVGAKDPDLIIEKHVRFIAAHSGNARYLNTTIDLFTDVTMLEIDRYEQGDYKDGEIPPTLKDNFINLLRLGITNFDELKSKLNPGEDAVTGILRVIFAGGILRIKAIDWDTMREWRKRQEEIIKSL